MNKADQSGLKYILRQNQTIYVSIEAESSIEGSKTQPIVLAFAVATPIFNINKKFEFLIVDYLGTNSDSPRDLITDFNFAVFTGKGLGKFMINLLQIV